MTGAELALVLKGGQMLANLGAGYFANKDAKRYARDAQQEAEAVRRRNKKAAQHSNLVNAFGTAGGLGAYSRPKQEEVNVKPFELGRGANILGTIGKGLGAGSTIASGYQGIKDIGEARARQKLSDEAAEMTLAKAKGELAASGVPLTTRADLAKKATAGDFSYFDNDAFEGLSDTGKQYGRAALIRNMDAEEARQLANRTTEAKLALINAQARTAGQLDSGQLTQFTAIGRGFGQSNPTATWEEVSKSPEYIAALETGGRQAGSVFKAGWQDGQFEANKQLTLEQTTALRDFGSLLKGDRLLVQANDIKGFVPEAIEGAARQDGGGDLALVKAIAKIFDPGSAVLLGEAETIEDLMSKSEKMRNTYGKLVYGTRLSPRVRKVLLEQAIGSYQNRAAMVNDKLTKAAESFAGKGNLPFDRYLRAASMYHMPPLEEYVGVRAGIFDRLNDVYDNKHKGQFGSINWSGVPDYAAIDRNVSFEMGNTEDENSWIDPALNWASSLFPNAPSNRSVSDETALERARRLQGGN